MLECHRQHGDRFQFIDSRGRRVPTARRGQGALVSVDAEMPWDNSSEIHALPPARRELVFRVRRQIAEGVYDTPAKWDAALDKLCGALADRDGDFEFDPPAGE